MKNYLGNSKNHAEDVSTINQHTLNRSISSEGTHKHAKSYLGTIGSSGVVGSGTILKFGGMALKHDNIDLSKLRLKKKLKSNMRHEYYKYRWHNEDVTVKKILCNERMLSKNTREVLPKISRAFDQEYLKLRIFSNEFIEPVLGIVNSPTNISVVYSYQTRSLKSQLYPIDDAEILEGFASAEQAFKWALHVCNGLTFLHSLNEVDQLYGLQLSSDSIFIDSNNTAKINLGDTLFSFERSKDNAQNFYPGYSAPEVLSKSEKQYQIQPAHMWSFACILWEIQHREQPFYGLTHMEIGIKVAFENLRLEMDNDTNAHIAQLFKICYSDEPGKRPKFVQILEVLEKFIVSIEV